MKYTAKDIEKLTKGMSKEMEMNDLEIWLPLVFTLITWISVYALEAMHDINYITIDGTEKLWDAGMFAVFHISYGAMLWYYTDFWDGFLLALISMMIRLVFHDGFINHFRGKDWCGKFTVDNDKDYWDMLMVWFYKKGIKPCIITIGSLIASVGLYIWLKIL